MSSSETTQASSIGETAAPMSTIVGSVFGAIRRSRAPLSAGALIAITAWILLADHVSDDWHGGTFVDQISSLISSLEGVALGTVLLLVIGILGSISTRASKLLLEPIMREIVERWQERRDVRRYVRSRFGSPFNVGGPPEDIAAEIVRRKRRPLESSCRWLREWLPGKNAYIDYHTDNFWVEPKWDRKIVPWVSGQILAALGNYYPKKSLVELQRELKTNPDLRTLIVSLERELERNPSGAFVGSQGKGFLERLEAVSSENEYRVAVTPALMLFIIGISLEWWIWALLMLPILILVYGSSLAKRDDVSLTALGWLLDGEATSHELESIRLWSKEEARRMIANGECTRGRASSPS